MILYGMKILSDIDLHLNLPTQGYTKSTITLSSDIPPPLKSKLTIGTYLHTTHEHRIFFYSDSEISKPFYEHQPLCYEAEGVVRFYWYFGDNTIYYEILSAPKKLAFWFAHPFFPLFLSIEKHYVLLHCSAVMIDDKAVVFLAPFKSGKSTLTNYMCHHGAKLITDDVLPTYIADDRVYCVASHPYSRPYRGAETLGEYISEYDNDPHLISAIYILQNDSDTTKTTITPIKGIEKFTLTRKNSLIYTLKGFRLEHEKHLGKILSTIPFFKISRPWGMEYIDETYQSIRKQIQEHIR